MYGGIVRLANSTRTPFFFYLSAYITAYGQSMLLLFRCMYTACVTPAGVWSSLVSSVSLYPFRYVYTACCSLSSVPRSRLSLFQVYRHRLCLTFKCTDTFCVLPASVRTLHVSCPQVYGHRKVFSSWSCFFYASTLLQHCSILVDRCLACWFCFRVKEFDKEHKHTKKRFLVRPETAVYVHLKPPREGSVHVKQTRLLDSRKAGLYASARSVTDS